MQLKPDIRYVVSIINKVASHTAIGCFYIQSSVISFGFLHIRSSTSVYLTIWQLSSIFWYIYYPWNVMWKPCWWANTYKTLKATTYMCIFSFSSLSTIIHYLPSHPPTSYLCLSWLSQVKAWAFSTFWTIIFCTTSRAWTSMVQMVMIRCRLALVMSPNSKLISVCSWVTCKIDMCRYKCYRPGINSEGSVKLPCFFMTCAFYLYAWRRSLKTLKIWFCAPKDCVDHAISNKYISI